MSPFIAYLLKMVLVSGVLYAYYHAVLRDKRFHQWNRFYLLAAVFLSITLPLFHIRVQQPAQDNALLLAVLRLMANVRTHETTVAVHPSFWASLTWEDAFLYAYMGIAGILLAMLALRLLRIRRLHDDSPHYHLEKITLVETRDAGTPFSFFNWIFWNKELKMDSIEGQRILRHELTHVRQQHSLDKMILQMACILFFPVIFFYVIRRELQLIHEYLADKQATRNEDLAEYAQLLLSQAFQVSPYAFANSFFQHPLKRRIAMMTRFNNPRFTYLRKVMFLPISLGLFGLLAFRVDAAHPNLAIRLEMAAGLRSKPVSLTPPKMDSIPVNHPLIHQDVSDVVKSQNIVAAEFDEKPSPNVLFKSHADTLPNVVVMTGEAHLSMTVQPLTRADTSSQLTNPTNVKIVPWSASNEPLFVIDGKPNASALKEINPNLIESITVLKDANATNLYGDAVKNGVILITTKKGNSGRDTLQQVTVVGLTSAQQDAADTEKIFTKVEIEARFPGGDSKWNEYVRQDITSHMDELQKDNRSGTCEILFVVHADGSVTGVQALSMEGSKLAELAVRIVRNGPKWIPAQQHGRNVSAFRKQKITFQMPD